MLLQHFTKDKLHSLFLLHVAIRKQAWPIRKGVVSVVLALKISFKEAILHFQVQDIPLSRHFGYCKHHSNSKVFSTLKVPIPFSNLGFEKNPQTEASLGISPWGGDGGWTMVSLLCETISYYKSLLESTLIYVLQMSQTLAFQEPTAKE